MGYNASFTIPRVLVQKTATYSGTFTTNGFSNSYSGSLIMSLSSDVCTISINDLSFAVSYRYRVEYSSTLIIILNQNPYYGQPTVSLIDTTTTMPLTMSPNTYAGLNTTTIRNTSTTITIYNSVSTYYSPIIDATLCYDPLYDGRLTGVSPTISWIQSTEPFLTLTLDLVLVFKTYICNDGLTLVDTTSSYACVFLPDPSVNTGKMYYIKDKSSNAGTYPIRIIAPTNVNIDNTNTFTIGNNGGCLTLVCDGTQYRIA